MGSKEDSRTTKPFSQKTMRRPYQLTGVVLFLFAIFMIRESLSLTFYTDLGPGPGFFPFCISVVLALLAILMVYNATYRETDPMPEDFFPTGIGYLRISAIIGALLSVILLLEPLGFRISVFVFLLFLLLALGRQNILVTLLVAIVFSVGTFYVFQKFLKVPLPVGLLGI